MMRVVVGAGLLVLASSTAAAHPLHATVAEVEWNPKSGRFEVAACLGISDLEDALSLAEHTRVSLERHKDIDRLLQNYVASRFQVIAHGDDSCRIEWVGHELELHNAWLYFEVVSTQAKADQSPANAQQKDAKGRTVGQSIVGSDQLAGLLPDEAAHFSRPPHNSSNPALSKCRLTNALLFDVRPDLTHQVTLEVSGQTVSTHHDVHRATVPVDFSQLSVQRSHKPSPAASN